MKTRQLALISVFTGLLSFAGTSHADDIDIYSGLGSAVNTPNVLFVMDNSANFEASSGGVTCKQQADGSLVINASSGTPTSMSGTVGGIEQCALWNVVKNLPVNADGTARVNIGFMVYNGTHIQDVNNSAYCQGSLGGCLTQPLIAMTNANKPGVLNWIAAWNTSPSASVGNVKAAGKATAATMQEAWAYFKGTTGLSTRDYSGVTPTAGCQKNFLIYIGNSFTSSGSPGDPSSGGPLAALTSAVDSLSQPSNLTSSAWSALKTKWKTPILNSVNTACGTSPGTYNFASPSSNHSENGGHYADEWTRFMAQSDLYSTPSGSQGLTTYTVGLLNTSSCKEEYAALLSNMAYYGGGKYFATTSYDSIVNAIMQILNEVQAVNSVFSSSSLPVSVNAQGTYLNQIYMGMFRPDPGAKPRWSGNLKQYQFIIDPATSTLKLGDSILNSALDSSGTGFISPNAISFWTCTNMSTLPYPNSYLATLTSAQLNLLSANHQSCAEPSTGFWVNDPISATATGGNFDLPDGERVERGGAAQQIRHTNLSDDYTATAGSSTNPRKLYTYCPTGSNCQSALTHSDNAFSTGNAGITASMFGSSTSVNISSLSRAEGLVTVATSQGHNFNTGDQVTIANASPSDYNGIYTITVTDATHFTYNLATVTPPTPASGSFTAQKAGTPVTISSLTRSGNTVTVNTSAAHGFNNAITVVISGATPSAYNGAHVITTAGPTSSTFTFTLNESPVTTAGSGTATSVWKTTGNSGGTACPCFRTVSVVASGVTRNLGSTTVYVITNGDITTTTAGNQGWSVGSTVTLNGIVDAGGATVGAYNGQFTIASLGLTSTGASNVNAFSFTIPSSAITPSSPASGSMTASLGSSAIAITLTRSGSTATATGAGHGYVNGDTISISGTPGVNEDAYLGSYSISNVTANTFDYTVTTSPLSPATGVGGTTMTATRDTGFNATDLTSLINWVRGQDSGQDTDEHGPGGTTNIRPSVHGDVLHSRPTVLNYGSYSIAITGTSDSGNYRTATASATDVATISNTGSQPIVTFANNQSCPVTVTSSTTFNYLIKNCGTAGAQSAKVGSKIVVFYGDNGGVFHAVNGNQVALMGSTGPGDEMWGFVPKEHFIKLKRLRANSPQLNLPSTPPGISPTPRAKDYFIDGTTGAYQLIDGNGNTTRAILYLAMRRGGSDIYAIDVTDPANPSMLWNIDNTSSGMSELGETWSQPKVARVKGYANPVLIMGAGYSTNEDNEPLTQADTAGRGVYILDALTGAVVWKATRSSGATSCSGSTTQAACVVSGMDYSIPADITLLDRDLDGYIDRLYAADLGGNIWRIDLEPSGNSTPDFWQVNRLAALGGFTGPCASTPPCNPTQRKFFYPPEVITATNAYPFDSVIIGSGDREHPLYVSTSTQRYNRIFLLKDTHTGNSGSGMNTITMAGTYPLFDATSTPWNGTLNGYYITLAAGEKVVNAPLAAAGYVYMGTNQPAAPSTTSCTGNLGDAYGYRLNPFAGTYARVQFDGGGLPPSPVAGVVNIVVNGELKQMPFLIGGGNPDCTGSDCKSALGGQKPPITVSTKRSRTYWYLEGK